ncbi:hypothetical protein PYW08_004078 [Mythimna loreyi]|uniref:Uncharacterized protein n=1 Tax=Mythimna loreyi TaxID=667449 RepID=A0ACC2QUE9_9NEOP|nr:hypothetical protein PYW08_004078 [Mythimna loreyi]
MSEEHDVDSPMIDDKETDENDEIVLENEESVDEREAVVEKEKAVVENGEVVENSEQLVLNSETVVHNGEESEENGEQVGENEKRLVDNAEDCPMMVDTEEPSANTSKEDSAIDAIDKETLSSEVDEKQDLYGANEGATLSWTADRNEFKVAWSLPEGVATANDYIALCCKAGKAENSVSVRDECKLESIDDAHSNIL